MSLWKAAPTADDGSRGGVPGAVMGQVPSLQVRPPSPPVSDAVVSGRPPSPVSPQLQRCPATTLPRNKRDVARAMAAPLLTRVLISTSRRRSCTAVSCHHQAEARPRHSRNHIITSRTVVTRTRTFRPTPCLTSTWIRTSMPTWHRLRFLGTTFHRHHRCRRRPSLCRRSWRGKAQSAS